MAENANERSRTGGELDLGLLKHRLFRLVEKKKRQRVLECFSSHSNPFLKNKLPVVCRRFRLCIPGVQTVLYFVNLLKYMMCSKCTRVLIIPLSLFSSLNLCFTAKNQPPARRDKYFNDCQSTFFFLLYHTLLVHTKFEHTTE